MINSETLQPSEYDRSDANLREAPILDSAVHRAPGLTAVSSSERLHGRNSLLPRQFTGEDNGISEERLRIDNVGELLRPAAVVVASSIPLVCRPVDQSAPRTIFELYRPREGTSDGSVYRCRRFRKDWMILRRRTRSCVSKDSCWLRFRSTVTLYEVVVCNEAWIKDRAVKGNTCPSVLAGRGCSSIQADDFPCTSYI